MPVMPFEGLEATTLRDAVEAEFGTLFVVEAEASFCGFGCEDEGGCSHAAGEDEDEADSFDRDFGDWAEDTFDPDFEARRAGDAWERHFWGD